ncbi:HAMP domain-containing sensor histidine kinase [Vagococcus lutrae]|uniref:sensor histidine kinase n=1 Tax=Vagococcus lutrae TaxID=81947 RepID=UPI002A7FB234|nr:HAMP domain-containing sensor histidine kinase [Vagococcus lutrae]MDY3706652.1 HAMP domain-containing sensor histidine kinase [Vagococcus lutrae]
MDWLRDATKNWKLKTNLMIYMLISLFFSIPLSLIFQSILIEARKNYIVSKTLSSNSNLIDKIIFSELLTLFINAIPLMFLMAFFYVFFNLFYNHKIQTVINYLNNQEEQDLNDMNELSNKVFELNEENIRLQQENFINIKKIHEISQKMDTILHEIKNPLTILSGDIEMLSTTYAIKDEKMNCILSRMSRIKKRIQDYIMNLNTCENIKKLEADIQSISINDFVNLIKTELHQWTYEISLTNNLNDLSQIIKLDSELFLQGITNVLKNSINYAENRIALNIYEDDRYLVVEIEDDGPGFSREALLNYNKPYFSENSLVGNMGLGLYITDEIMKKQGIEMILSNQIGANTKLFIKKT